MKIKVNYKTVRATAKVDITLRVPVDASSKMIEALVQQELEGKGLKGKNACMIHKVRSTTLR